jgi:hypothetical protein
MLPTAGDLDDPDGFVHREQMDFSELDKMLGEAAGKPDLTKGPEKGPEKDPKGTDGTGDSGKDARGEGDGTE